MYGGSNYLVTWSRLDQDSSAYGIYGDFVAGSSASNPVPEPLSAILLGCGVFFLNSRFASRK